MKISDECACRKKERNKKNRATKKVKQEQSLLLLLIIINIKFIIKVLSFNFLIHLLSVVLAPSSADIQL